MANYTTSQLEGFWKGQIQINNKTWVMDFTIRVAPLRSFFTIYDLKGNIFYEWQAVPIFPQNTNDTWNIHLTSQPYHSDSALEPIYGTRFLLLHTNYSITIELNNGQSFQLTK